MTAARLWGCSSGYVATSVDAVFAARSDVYAQMLVPFRCLAYASACTP